MLVSEYYEDSEDVEQMRRLLEMYEKIKDNEKFRAFFEEEDRIKIEKQQI